MLGVSGALLLVTSTVAGSIDPAKQASFKYYPAGNILIQIRNTVGSSFDNEAEPYGSVKLQLEENPLEDQALMQELEKVDGIEKITAFDSVYMTATFFGRKWFYHEHFRLLSNLKSGTDRRKAGGVILWNSRLRRYG